MGAVLHVGRVSRHIERKCIGGTRGKGTRIQECREFLAEIKKEFGEGKEESVKVAELRRLEQERKMMKEFV